MRIAICGGSGFIGQALTDYYTKRNDEVIIVTRQLPKGAQPLTDRNTPLKPGGQLSYVTWEQLEQEPALMEGLDALVNLAGASLSQRWSAKNKDAILSSRLSTVSKVASLLIRLAHKPPVVIQASAVAIYGTCLDQVFNEASPKQINDFPSHVVEEWEQAAEQIEGVRLIKLRISVVLGNNGGAFPLMMLPYRLFVGGRIGSGQQWLSWIHIDDMVRLIDFCITNEAVEGAVNASAPEPVTNDTFGQTVAKVYNRPHWFPVPSFMMKALLGEMSMMLLKGQRVIPAKAQQLGFNFQYPSLEEALLNLKQSSS